MFKYGHVFWFSGQHNLFQELGNFVRTFINITAGLSSHSSWKKELDLEMYVWMFFPRLLVQKNVSPVNVWHGKGAALEDDSWHRWKYQMLSLNVIKRDIFPSPSADALVLCQLVSKQY